MMHWLPRWVARLRATIHTKLLAAFLLIALLLLSAAVVGLIALAEMNRRAQETAQLQRKIAAYGQLSHDSITQLYGVATALLQPEERRLDATLRQLKQFGYDLDRLQFLAQGEIDVMGRVRADFEAFIKVVSASIELIRAGKTAEGQRLQLSVASPLADRLERPTNELVNKAEADLVGGIEIAKLLVLGLDLLEQLRVPHTDRDLAREQVQQVLVRALPAPRRRQRDSRIAPNRPLPCATQPEFRCPQRLAPDAESPRESSR